LKNLKLSYKKVNPSKIIINKKIHQQKVKQFKNQIKTINHNNIVSIDEVHFDSNMKPNYGWSKVKEPIKHTYKNTKQYRCSVICAISNEKIIHKQLIEGNVNGVIFNDFIKNVNKLCSNKILLMDNAKIHHNKELINIMNKSTNKILYNIPYSPETNPIEKVFSISKYKYRHLIINDNSRNKIIKAINKSFDIITKEHLQNIYNATF